jgi:hypothetical protein
MKTVTFILMVLLVSVQANGQIFGKKNKEDPKDARIDSLATLNQTLTLQLDSVSRELEKYAVKSDTSLKSAIIDTAAVMPDTTTTAAGAVMALPSAALVSTTPSQNTALSATSMNAPPPAVQSTALNDSIAVLLQENTLLKATVDSLKTAWEKNMVIMMSEEISRSNTVNYLKQLRELVDAKVITEAEFITIKKKYLVNL